MYKQQRQCRASAGGRMISVGQSQEPQFINTSNPRIPIALRIEALDMSVAMARDGCDHKKWEHISRKVSAAMGLTTPMTGSQVKGQVNSYIVCIFLLVIFMKCVIMFL
jgi:hypothetical protein